MNFCPYSKDQHKAKKLKATTRTITRSFYFRKIFIIIDGEFVGLLKNKNANS